MIKIKKSAKIDELRDLGVITNDDNKSRKVRILKDKCGYLYDNNIPFTLVKSGSTYELASSMWNEKAFRSGFTIKDLGFIKSVKQYVDKHGIAIDFVDTDYRGSGIEYIKVNQYNLGDRIDNLIYVDVNSAYWQTAFNLGIISYSIFKRGEDFDKTVRLAALGSLAKSKSVWKFDGVDFKKSAIIRSLETENLWFAICKRVSDMMVDLSKSLGDDFVFYWVDGIYVRDRNNSLQKCLDTFIHWGYTSKFAKIPYIEFHEKGFKVQGATIQDVKEFTWQIESKNGKKLSNTPISDYLKDMELLEYANSILYPAKKSKSLKVKKKG